MSHVRSPIRDKIPAHSRLGASTNATRKMDTLRRIAARLSEGQDVDLPSMVYLAEIADEFERCYVEMSRRYKPGWVGMPLGLVDRYDVPIHVGDHLSFDAREWGDEESRHFVMGWDAEECCPLHIGARGDLRNWCEVTRHYDGSAPIRPEKALS